MPKGIKYPEMYAPRWWLYKEKPYIFQQHNHIFKSLHIVSITSFIIEW